MIRFHLSQTKRVMLKVFDVLGNEKATLVDRQLAAGEHEVHFSPKNLPSGVYLYTLTIGKDTQTRKMLLLN